MTLTYSFYILILRPFIRLSDNIRIFTSEILLAANLGFLFKLNKDDSEDEDGRYSYCNLIIYVYILILLINDIFLTYDVLYFILRNTCYKQKKYRLTN